MIVSARNPAWSGWEIAISHPKRTIHRRLNTIRRGLFASGRSTISLPNGANVQRPSLIAWMPKGIPTMVRQEKSPEDVSHPGQKASKDQPENISDEAHPSGL